MRSAKHAAALCLCAAVLATGCESVTKWKPPTSAQEPVRPQAVPTPQPTPEPAPALPQNPLETIARFEDARTDGDGLLQLMLLRGETPIRQRAAFALGRLPFPEHGDDVTRALCTALDDKAASVRAAAAFSLGIRADRAAAPALLARWKDADDTVRARIVEAASRIDDAKLREAVLGALKDKSNEVRAEAALAPHRWQKQHTPPEAATVDAALVGLLRPREGAAESGVVFAEDPEVVYRALFSLARRKSEQARAAFHAALASADVRQRTYAAQGLAGLEPDPEGQVLLRDALADKDWRVVCEAAQALGRSTEPPLAEALAPLLAHPSPHVRRCAYDLLGRMSGERDAALQLIERATEERSRSVGAFALAPRAKLLGVATASFLEELAADEDPILRAGVAGALVNLPAERAVPMLVKLADDANSRVASIAIGSLGKHPTPASREKLRALLASPDNGKRLDALIALRDSQVPEDLPFLVACFDSSRGDIASEIAYSAVESAAKLDGDAVRDFLKRACSHASPYTRKRAREVLAERFPNEPVPRSAAPGARAAEVPVVERDPHELVRNPRVVIETTRGAMEFELFADEAPVHVHNFLEHARAGHYAGTTFHRVVPDFVVQGGDPRGDGNGGASWRGDSLRAEFTPRKFVRGSLGMPRNDDPDSGGSQIFVTHRETPHLDGRYTLFGQLKLGAEILDEIEVGDRILGLRVLEPAGTR